MKSQEYRDLAQKQEDRFKARHAADAQRIAELENANSKLEARLKRTKDGRCWAEEAHNEAIHDLNTLAKDVKEHVAPAMDQATEAADTTAAACALTRQRERMFKALVARGNELAAQLGTDVPHAEVRGRGDAAMYLVYFD